MMNQHAEELAKSLGAWFIGSGVLVIVLRWVWRVFIRATDVTVSYNWSFDGTMNDARNFRPNLDIRNRSQARTYRLANIKYFSQTHKLLAFDNSSIWGTELKPGSIENCDKVTPTLLVASLEESMATQVVIRLQDGREIVGQGPGQQLSHLHRLARRLRSWLDRASLLVE